MKVWQRSRELWTVTLPLLLTPHSKFAKRVSKKRTKTVLGWVYAFLAEAGEAELLKAFEEAITDSLPK